ncbi:MAG: hypothetical protein NVS1B7_1680 [Candidatus Saccharimonadales bacterium]
MLNKFPRFQRNTIVVALLFFLVLAVGSILLLSKTDKQSIKTQEPENLLNDSLPIQTSDYQITYSYSPATKKYYYKITLYGLLNRPDQYQNYLMQLKQYKTEALQYIKDNHGDTANLNIQYVPPEATSL